MIIFIISIFKKNKNLQIIRNAEFITKNIKKKLFY